MALRERSVIRTTYEWQRQPNDSSLLHAIRVPLVTAIFGWQNVRPLSFFAPPSFILYKHSSVQWRGGGGKQETKAPSCLFSRSLFAMPFDGLVFPPWSPRWRRARSHIITYTFSDAWRSSDHARSEERGHIFGGEQVINRGIQKR